MDHRALVLVQEKSVPDMHLENGTNFVTLLIHLEDLQSNLVKLIQSASFEF